MNDRAEMFRTNAVRYFVVDAFTNRPFAGNPAAVVLLDDWKDEDWLQLVAAEMNLSETAFLVPGPTGYKLRWFSPQTEVDLCGHATLASARVLAELGLLADGAEVCFQTRSGELTVERQQTQMQLDFPALAIEACSPPAGLLEALGIEALFVGRSKFDYLIEVASAKTVRELTPDFYRLAGVECRGTMVTSRCDDPRFDFVSRFFAPAVGIDEDPATGSAHCCLAPYWAAKLDKTTMVAFQASARGGVIHVEPRGQRVLLRGESVLVARGELIA